MNINATLLAQAVVMIVFVAICWKYIYPPILSVMKEREKRISDGLEAAKKADDSLEEAKLAFDKELDQAKAEAAEILEKANARASQIVSDASSKAEAEAEKILTSASTTIENEKNKAKEELREQMSEIIIDTTQKILGDEISKEKHEEILKKAAEELWAMIELTPLARPYAKALFDSAVESKNIDEMAEELKIMAVASKTEGVINTIENPSLSRQDVVSILVNLFEDSISDKSKKLLEILSENKRLNLLETIYLIYQELLEEHKDQKSVEVFVATDIGEESKNNIEQKLKKTYGKDANVYFSKDPNMMGGLSVKIGDETLDLSIRGKVKKLINQLNF